MSVNSQVTDISFSHFIRVDKNQQGCGIVRNLIESDLPAEFDWVAFIDDDDIILPNHLQSLASASNFGDIIYSDCETVGWTKTWQTKPFDLESLYERNYIPVTVLIRRNLFKQMGGFRKVFAEDWDLWKRCSRVGARFIYVPKITWLYRRLSNSTSMLESNQIVF